MELLKSFKQKVDGFLMKTAPENKSGAYLSVQQLNDNV